MKKRLFSPLLAAALAAAVALTAAALPAFADGGEETPITIGQSQQQAECTCTALCTGDSVNADCPVCGAEEADLTACEGLEALPATLSNALPATALAAAPENQVIYVGGVKISSTGYWTTDKEGKVTSAGATQPSDNYIHYDADTNTLTLHNATIKEALDYGEKPPNSLIFGAAIGVLNQNGAAELTITLAGTNTIAEVGKGIFVLASSTSTGGATLTITGGGSLDASASQTGIWVQSNNGDATLTIRDADVEAEVTGSNGDGVLVQAGQSSNASLSVNGGSLTATGSGTHGAGIRFLFGSSDSSSRTPSLTVSGNAIVRANGSAGGITSNSSTGVQYGTGSNSTGGIVFDGKDGTVYGTVELKEDLTIGKGESLTIPDGASLNTNGKLTVDGGTLTQNGTVTGDIIYKVTGVSLNKNTTTIKVGGTETLTATVEPANATNKAVTWSSDNISVATVDANGLVTAVAEGSATITVTTEDGSKTATCTVIVTNNGSGPVLPPQPSDPAPSQPTGDGSSGGTGGTSSAAPRQQSSVVHNVSNSSAYRKGEYEFWMKVRTKIVSADPGEVIEVNARDNDKMPNSVMQALAAKEDVTLRICWNGGEEIVIPSAAALQEKMRMFYPLSYLAKFDFAQTPAKKVK